VSQDPTKTALDRGELLKRAGVAAAAASTLSLERASGAWAGIKRPEAVAQLRVGTLLTLSGPNSAPAIDVKKGFVTYLRAHGGRLGGRRIRLVDGDDAGDPATAIRQAQKLVNEDQVDLLWGIFYSNILLGVRDTIDGSKVPTVVANAAANAITRERRSEYIFRTSYTNYQLGASLARWCANRLTKERLVLVAANYAAGQENAAAFKQLYEAAGGKVEETIFTPFPVTPDYQPYLSRIQDRGARGVWCFSAGGNESIKFVRQYTQFGLKRNIPLVGINNLTDPQTVLDAEGDAAVGIRTSANWAPTLKNAENKKFLAAYERFGGVPSAFAELGYVAAQFIDLSLRKVGGQTGNKDRLLRAMRTLGTWQSPGGKLAMDPRTHQVTLPWYLRTVVKQGNSYTQRLIANLGVIRDPGS
jgi:branched-chain amino acid transport system substrate-binding protein